ncbi:hypothetical protein HID58_047069 [Brassica napus]|uniref:CHCH domain-containing protein n=2 Tax=Brassica napus TaxID=3708 RepID=A0ABQ8AZN5_BRANA|nr:hypothetical protein HID58_047069 [Brassica napus]CDY64509.1 BnaCnng44040D [Brassica napus]
MGRRKGFGGGGRKSYSTGAKFRSSPLFNKKSKPAKDEKDEKAPPPAKVVTLPVESRRESFFSSIADEKVEVAAVSAIDDNDKFKDYTESCSISYKAFEECLNAEGNKLSKCHIFMDSLFECRKNSSSFNF